MKKPAAMTYKDGEIKKITSEFLRNKLKLKHIEVKRAFSQKYPHVEKFLAEKGVDLGKIRKHSAKIIGAGAITGTLLLASPHLKGLPASHEVVEKLKGEGKLVATQPEEVLVRLMDGVLPDKARPLSREEEKALESIFTDMLGVKARATLEGEHLNTTYGLIGAEQHLRRYPGDTLRDHGSGEILQEGMAPGLGAWGYFAYSKDQLTPDLVETEKWYAVAQTLYLPDWERRQPYLQQWYKYRKVLIVNTQNGKAVIGAIADSGPAIWTGKSFGGSPEVMEYLGGPKYKKGTVAFFFVDDPENRVPLGPVDYTKMRLPELAQKP